MTPIDMISVSMEFRDKLAKYLAIPANRIQASVTMKPTGTDEKPGVRLTTEVLVDGRPPTGRVLKKVDEFIRAITYSQTE